MTLNLKLIRSIKKNLSFYITASVLTALTIMLWVGAFTVSDTVTATYDDLFSRSNVEDACFTTSGKIPEEDIAFLESEYDLVLEEQIYRNTSYEDTRLRLFAQTERLNIVQISEGRGIEDPDDILITYDYATANGLEIGDTVELSGETYNIRGLCLKPDYSAMFAEFTDTFPDGKTFGIGIVSRERMGSSDECSSYYSVRYNSPDKEKDFRKYIYETYGTSQYIAKNDNPRTGALILSAGDIKAEFSVYSPILMFVVTVVIAMVLSRTVRRENKKIGTLMALGYNRGEIVSHYVMYAVIPSVAGCILGAVGSIPFSRLFCIYMFSFSEHIEYTPRIPAGILIAALLIPPFVYCLTSLVVIRRSLGSDVVMLLRGGMSRKIPHVLRNSKMRFKWLYNIRTVLANRGRSITLLVGITVATMAVMVSGLYQHAYDDFLENKVPNAMLGGQYEYGFTDFQNENPYGDYAIFDVSFGVKGTDSLFNLIGVDEGCDLIDTKTLSGDEMTYDGYYMTSAAARRFDIHKGDSFTFYNTLSMEETTIEITDIISNDVLSLVVTGKENAADILHREADEYDVIISLEPLDIPQELLNKSASLEDYRSSTESAFRTATVVLYIVKVIGALICVLVVVMLAGMIVEENRRNISLLDVLGYGKGEIRSMILSSNHLIVLVGFLLGVPLGIAISEMIAEANAKTSGMFMTIELTPGIFLTGMLFVGTAYILSMLLAGGKLRKVDMVECLKEDRE